MTESDWNMIFSFTSYIRRTFGSVIDDFGTKRYNPRKTEDNLIILDCYLTDKEYDYLIKQFYNMNPVNRHSFI